jgi:multicomponent Na+:H+ antiporter subunit B
MMRKFISLILILIIAAAVFFSLEEVPFGATKSRVREYYLDNGIKQTGASNIVTSVVVSYRGFDTLGEVTVLFLASIGLSAILYSKKEEKKKKRRKSSLILYTGCRFLFPFILLFGAYIFIHGHLTPGGGFQGGAVIASGFLLIMLGCWGWEGINRNRFKITESLSGLAFIVIGLLGLLCGGSFLLNYLPKGVPNELFSAGIIPLVYIAIGFKVGSEITGIINNMVKSG